MKKVCYLLIALFAVTACQKNPSTSDVENQYLVYTTYKYGYDFTQTPTVYVPTTIVLLDNSDTPDVWDDDNSDAIIEKYIDNLEAANYVVTQNPLAPRDLVLNLTFIENTTIYVDDYYYWWWDPYWWDGGYWPSWYYPYPAVYGYTVGALVGELVQPDLEALKQNQQLPTVWYSYISGPENGTATVITTELIGGIDQAFAQTPEIKLPE